MKLAVAAALAILTAPAYAQMPMLLGDGSICDLGSCWDNTAPNIDKHRIASTPLPPYIVAIGDGSRLVALGQDCPASTRFVVDIYSDRLRLRICTNIAKETTIESNPYLYQH